ncbi:Protein CBG25980 [Caenorhabditis briggsae]|uniref:Protein CBG25980 n=1 Tax=Caenorhabditis briggsae TaxID=6238 RepID=B6IKT0_CAEBR|nr:Protein CBG25980 [Caenorhabditis briggsae]CAS00510.1 Protein CBG25980 [Caenorhabditis briggsae]
MKQYFEFEKRKKEKLERQRLLNTGANTTTTSVNWNTTKKVKRSTNQSLEEPFPLPTYEEYSKIKNDCLLLPSFEDYLKTKGLEISDFVKTRDACDTFPTYDEYVTKFAKYALEELGNRKSKNTETFGNQRIGRTGRQVYSDFKAAGEFQYLENKSNNLLRHTTEVMCDIFNEHTSLLETLIRENPRRYIQKQLNHSAIRVRSMDTNDDIIQVTFCKEIDDSDIEVVDLTHFDGFKTSLAFNQGQIPIRIKQFRDKIWYYKNDPSGGIISSSLALHPMANNVTNFKTFKEFDLNFLDDKVIFHEHILLDTKTNIEEELINEMREKADVSIDLHSNSQDGMIPHEILDEVSSIFEKYYIRIWRIYVTIGVTLFYIFIGRSIWMVLSPKTFFDSRKNINPRNRNPIFVRTKNHFQGEDYQGVELQDFKNEHRRSLVVD